MAEDNTRYEQVKMVRGEDCGNAPKKEFIHEKTIEDIHWNIIGRNTLQGKDQVFGMLRKLMDKTPTELIISNIITHGYSGSLNGILNLENNMSYAFCNIYRFNSSLNKTKIKEITSYIIDISK